MRIFLASFETLSRMRPNVVLVILESFSSYRSSVSGNRLDTTPHLARLAKDGILFSRTFTAHSGTARGVFATLTGIPDVSLVDTASRNPNAVEQHSIVNAFKGYDKYYFIGGSTTWANVRGVLSRSIDGIRIVEEGDFGARGVDVWGISDKDLFFEANSRLRETRGPFFAVIQTAANHRPYTIPPNETGFRRMQVSDDELRRNGFENLPQLEGFRYMDYCVGQFIEAARREAYFGNTVFAFIGDHGITGEAGQNVPNSWTLLRLTTGHTPFIIYAPGLIKPRRIDTPAMQVDVLPTLAGLAGVSYLNKTLGRDLLAQKRGEDRVAFTLYHNEGPLLGVLDGEYYVNVRADGSQGRMNALLDGDPAKDLQDRDPARFARLRELALGIYESAQYMLTHNRKEPHP